MSPPKAPDRLDAALCEALASRAAAGERGAWRDLIETIWPVCARIVRANRSMGSLAQSDDNVRDVLTRIVEKLGSGERRALKQYADWRIRHPGKGFDDWLRILTANAVRTFVRDRLSGAEPRGVTGDPSVKRLLNEFAHSEGIESLGVRPPITASQTARQLIDFAKRRLPEAQMMALMLWIEGASPEEIDVELSLGGSEAARKLIRAAVALLRRHFAGAAKKKD